MQENHSPRYKVSLSLELYKVHHQLSECHGVQQCHQLDKDHTVIECREMLVMVSGMYCNV